MRRWWWILSLAAGVVLLVWFGYGYYEANLKVEPEKLLAESLKKTMAASGYRYEVVAELIIKDQRRSLSKVTGERDQHGNFHIKGELTGEKVEVYQVQDSTYVLDTQSGKWMVVPGNELGRQKMLMAEIDPFANLQFKSYGTITYCGRQKNEMGNTVILEFRPQLTGPFMTAWFQDFTYRVWIERRSHWLRQVVITAQSRTTSQARANFTIRLHDFGAAIAIKPPL